MRPKRRGLGELTCLGQAGVDQSVTPSNQLLGKSVLHIPVWSSLTTHEDAVVMGVQGSGIRGEGEYRCGIRHGTWALVKFTS